ncbi:amidase [Rhodoligotrophos ferricapiens]|uniref:amidase n=1 Tax=Rhodoligotrophos ferricapiens TaxID=3069264 RepID=UPI00315DE1F4
MSERRQILSRSATELARLVRNRELSPVELIDASLGRIAEINPQFNAFTEIYGEEARYQAKAAEAAVRAGERIGPLHGIPVALKDMTPIKGKVTTLGSRAFQHHVPSEDAWIVTALRRAGAIVVGKTTTPEFAFSSFTQSPLFGVTRNPCDPARTSGGSSGGSAVAVATGAVPLAEGTDMGGSIRIPASFCGIVGLKPSLGRIPLDILPSTFDNISHFGPLARSCADAALFLSAAQGPDDCDIQSIPSGFDYDGSLELEPRGIRLALSLDFGFYAIDPDVRRNTLDAAERLRSAGVVVEPVDLGWSPEILDIWMDYWRVFMAAYFADAYDTQAPVLDPAVKELIEQGRRISAVQYKRLEIGRTRFWNSFRSVLRNFDALICPTMALPAPAATLTDRDFGRTDEEGRYHGLDMTAPFNLIGQCPALSVPSGLTRDGLPTGLQIVGRRFDDLTVLKLGALVESLFQIDFVERM